MSHVFRIKTAAFYLQHVAVVCESCLMWWLRSLAGVMSHIWVMPPGSEPADIPLMYTLCTRRVVMTLETWLKCEVTHTLIHVMRHEPTRRVHRVYIKGTTLVSRVRTRRQLLMSLYDYGVALVSRIDKMIGLFCKRALYKRRYSAKETCHFIDPTDRSHPISYDNSY